MHEGVAVVADSTLAAVIRKAIDAAAVDGEFDELAFAVDDGLDENENFPLASPQLVH